MPKSKNDLFSKIEEAARYLESHVSIKPKVGVILGTGLGDLAKRITDKQEIPYTSIPHFPQSTVESHAGQLGFGKIGKQQTVVMEGRFHFYEGYDLEQVTFAVRVMRRLGAEVLVISNVVGAMNPKFKRGDLMLIEDHINWMGVNPLVGPNDERLGIRFPDMVEPYSKRLIGLAEKIARSNGISCHKGVYVGVSGPNLETRAEYRMLRQFSDVVGMSTVPEVIVAVHAGFEILGVSVISDLCDPDHLEPVDIDAIIQTANAASPKLIQLIEAVVKQL